MRCPMCDSSELRVDDTRSRPRRNVVMRRRQCRSCGHFFYTEERYIPGLEWGDVAEDDLPEGSDHQTGKQ